MENISEFYYERLQTTTNPGLELARMFGSVFERDVGKSELILFNRLLRLYSRFTLYFAILDLASMKDLDFNNLFPIISYFCKKRLEQRQNSPLISFESLEKNVLALEKMVRRQEKQKLIARPLDE